MDAPTCCLNVPTGNAADSAVEYPRLVSACPVDTETLKRPLAAHADTRLQGLAQRLGDARSHLLDLTAADESLS